MRSHAFLAHPFAVVFHILGQPFGVAVERPLLDAGVDGGHVLELRRGISIIALPIITRHRVQIGPIGGQAQPLRLERDRRAARERVIDRGAARRRSCAGFRPARDPAPPRWSSSPTSPGSSIMAKSRLRSISTATALQRRLRRIRRRPLGPPPCSPPRPPPAPAAPPRPARRKFRDRAINSSTREDEGSSTSCANSTARHARQRPPRPPQVQGGGMPMPDRLLPRRGCVDRPQVEWLLR